MLLPRTDTNMDYPCDSSFTLTVVSHDFHLHIQLIVISICFFVTEPECTKAMSESSASGGVQQACAICLTEPRNTALQCGHLFCWDCAQRVDHCPVCRKFVSHRIRLFQ